MSTNENTKLAMLHIYTSIYLFEMTTTGNLIAIIEYLVKVNHLLEMTTNENT